MMMILLTWWCMVSAVGLMPLAYDHAHHADEAITDDGLDQRVRSFLSHLGEGAPLEGYFSDTAALTYTLTTHSDSGTTVGRWRLPAMEVVAAINGPLYESFNLNPEGQPIGLLIHQLAIRGDNWHRVAGNRYVPPGEDTSSAIFIEWRREESEWVISAVGDERFSTNQLPRWCC
jgi:hypothetical protein